MTAEDEPVFEAEEQVLAHRLDPHQLPTVEALGDTGQARARVRCLDV
jgi:hypothetical protein